MALVMAKECHIRCYKSYQGYSQRCDAHRHVCMDGCQWLKWTHPWSNGILSFSHYNMGDMLWLCEMRTVFYISLTNKQGTPIMKAISYKCKQGACMFLQLCRWLGWYCSQNSIPHNIIYHSNKQTHNQHFINSWFKWNDMHYSIIYSPFWAWYKIWHKVFIYSPLSCTCICLLYISVISILVESYN